MSDIHNRNRSAQTKEELTQSSDTRDDVGQGSRPGQVPVDFKGWKTCGGNCGLCKGIRAQRLRAIAQGTQAFMEQDGQFYVLRGPSGPDLTPAKAFMALDDAQKTTEDYKALLADVEKFVRDYLGVGTAPKALIGTNRAPVRCSRCRLYTSRPNDLGQCSQCSRLGTVGVIPATDRKSRDFENPFNLESAPRAHSRVQMPSDEEWKDYIPEETDPFPVPFPPTTLEPPEAPRVKAEGLASNLWDRGYLRAIEAALAYVKNLDWGRERILESLENRRKWIEKRIENGKSS